MLRFLLLFSFLNPIVCLNAYESPRHDMFKWHANCRSRAAAVHVAQGCVSFRFEARLWHRKIPKNREKIAASSQWVEWRNGTKNSLVENIFLPHAHFFLKLSYTFEMQGVPSVPLIVTSLSFIGVQQLAPTTARGRLLSWTEGSDPGWCGLYIGAITYKIHKCVCHFAISLPV